MVVFIIINSTEKVFYMGMPYLVSKRHTVGGL